MEPISPAIDATLLEQCGWAEVIAVADPPECIVYVGLLSTASQAVKKDDPTRACALELLARVCAPMLWSHTDGVFAPADVIKNLSDAELDALVGFEETIADPELRARVADVLWLRRRDRRFADHAVAAYLDSARRLEDVNKWTSGFARIERAVRLGEAVGKTRPPYESAIQFVQETIERIEPEDHLYLSARCLELLLDRWNESFARYAEHGRRLADAAAAAKDHARASLLFDLTARLSDRSGDPASARAARIAAAESAVVLASEKAAAGQAGVAAVHLQSAIEAYRRIGKEPVRIEELLAEMRMHQKRATEELQTFSTSVDLTAEVKRAVDGVRGKATVHEAAIALAIASRPPCAETMRDSLAERIRASPMRFFFAQRQIDPKTGRTTGQRPGASTDVDAGVNELVYEDAKLHQHLTASFLEQARRTICDEHQVRDGDLLALVTRSPFVPPGREERFARGLAAGLRGDFLLAAALLIPQMEASLRFVLEQNGGRGYGLGADGLQDVYGLDHLLRDETLLGVLGDDVIVDLRGLLIERFGSNLRHEEAHGLMDDVQYRSTTVMYFWWLTLHLCVVCMLAATGNREPAPR